MKQAPLYEASFAVAWPASAEAQEDGVIDLGALMATLTDTISTREEHLLRCVKNDDGSLSWKPQSSFQISR